MRLIVAACLLLAGCGGQVKESNESAIANQAESLERAANATTDQMIKQIEDGAKADAAAEAGAATPPASNSTRP
jgi:hypothetical protein